MVNQKEAPDWFVPSAEVAALGRQRWCCHNRKAMAKNIKWDRLATASCSRCRPGGGCRVLFPKPHIAQLSVNEGTASGNAARHVGNEIQKAGFEPATPRRGLALQASGQPVDRLLEFGLTRNIETIIQNMESQLHSARSQRTDTKPRKQK